MGCLNLTKDLHFFLGVAGKQEGFEQGNYNLYFSEII